MKLNKRYLIPLVVLALLLCLLPVSALADPLESPAAEETTPVLVIPEESAVPSALPELPAVEETETVYNEADQTLYTVEGSRVYNNGGTVYNNGAIVFNNAGLVYNNEGLVYNNAGTVYSNGGTVYNNAGQVFNNGAEIFDNGGVVAISTAPGFYRVELSADYSALVEIDGIEADPEGGYVVGEDVVCTIAAKPGVLITAAETSSGELKEQPNGSYTLSGFDSDFNLKLEFVLEAPVFSLEAGTYAQGKTLELSAAENARIFYTTDGSEPGMESLIYSSPIDLGSGCTVKALAVTEGAGMSEVVSCDYAIAKLTAPVFAEAKKDYKPEELPITVENAGIHDVRIQNIVLSGPNAEDFVLSHTAGYKVPAGSTEDVFWTLRPVAELPEGEYTAIATVSFDSGDTAELKIFFEVD